MPAIAVPCCFTNAIVPSLPEHIRDAYLNHAKQIDYSIEMVLEMALADFLDRDSLTFTDCKPQIGLPENENQDT